MNIRRLAALALTTPLIFAGFPFADAMAVTLGKPVDAPAGPAQELPAYLVVEAEGQGATRDDALKAALREAIRHAVGSFISSETMTENMQLINDKIIEYNTGYVEDYNIISDDKKDNIETIKIKATVANQTIVKSLEKIGIKSTELRGEQAAYRYYTTMDRIQRAVDVLSPYVKRMGNEIFNIELVSADIVRGVQDPLVQNVPPLSGCCGEPTRLKLYGGKETGFVAGKGEGTTNDQSFVLVKARISINRRFVDELMQTLDHLYTEKTSTFHFNYNSIGLSDENLVKDRKLMRGGFMPPVAQERFARIMNLVLGSPLLDYPPDYNYDQCLDALRKGTSSSACLDGPWVSLSKTGIGHGLLPFSTYREKVLVSENSYQEKSTPDRDFRYDNMGFGSRYEATFHFLSESGTSLYDFSYIFDMNQIQSTNAYDMKLRMKNSGRGGPGSPEAIYEQATAKVHKLLPNEYTPMCYPWTVPTTSNPRERQGRIDSAVWLSAQSFHGSVVCPEGIEVVYSIIPVPIQIMEKIKNVTMSHEFLDERYVEAVWEKDISFQYISRSNKNVDIYSFASMCDKLKLEPNTVYGTTNDIMAAIMKYYPCHD